MEVGGWHVAYAGAGPVEIGGVGCTAWQIADTISNIIIGVGLMTVPQASHYYRQNPLQFSEAVVVNRLGLLSVKSGDKLCTAFALRFEWNVALHCVLSVHLMLDMDVFLMQYRTTDLDKAYGEIQGDLILKAYSADPR